MESNKSSFETVKLINDKIIGLLEKIMYLEKKVSLMEDFLFPHEIKFVKTKLKEQTTPTIDGGIKDKITIYKSKLFSAYLTGQNDVKDKQSGGDGRSFHNWYKDNYEKD